ncbi:MAG: sensor histidine kinase, partial [Acidobacteriota bacterium]
MDAWRGEEEQTHGIVLTCDAQGSILEVLHDGEGVDSRPGQLLVRMMDRGSIGKALSFLVKVKDTGTAFDWALNVSARGTVRTLHFAGFREENDRLVIVGSSTRAGMLKLYDEILQIANEQAIAIRSIAKERAELARSRAEKDGAIYDEISRLNNELLTLQRELAKKNVELARPNELKNYFLGMAAHDLRSSLGHIVSYSEFLIDETSEVLGGEHFEFLTIINSSGQFMLGLVEDLLDVAKIESGRLDLDMQPTDLHGLVSRSVVLNNTLASKKDIRIVLDHFDEIEAITIDSDRIEQVLNNLLSNAVKFSHPHSAIRVAMRKDSDFAVLSIADEGTGIPADRLDKVFKPFGKASVTGTGGEKSTGLGLAI